jgi:hypothetical protein
MSTFYLKISFLKNIFVIRIIIYKLQKQNNMHFNWYILPLAALIPMVVAMVWYNPKVFGNAWMKAAGMTEEKAKGANMFLVFGLSFLFSCMLSISLMPMTIHQMSFMSVFDGMPNAAKPETELGAYVKNFYDLYGTRFRTFKHGALHGTIGGLFIALPIVGIMSLFEMKSFKFIAIHVGYYIVSMALMGGVICQFL